MKLANLIETSSNQNWILRPYIIAEVGVNHEGDMDLAKRMICEAKEGGAHAVKFQAYKAETIALKDSPAYWNTDKESTMNFLKSMISSGKKNLKSLKYTVIKQILNFLALHSTLSRLLFSMT